MDDRNDGLQKIIDEALESMAAECAGDFDPQACNLAEFCRCVQHALAAALPSVADRSSTLGRPPFHARPTTQI